MQHEDIAAGLLESILGVPVVKVDTGKQPGMHDLELMSDGAPCGCVEVTSTVVGPLAAFRNTLRKRGRSIPAAALQHTWRLELSPTASLKNVERHRDELITTLRGLEASGKTRFTTIDSEGEHPEIQDLRTKLGVQSGHASREEGSAGEILLDEAPTGRAFSARQVVAAVKREAAKEDNIRKLNNCPHAQRHFFVLIDADTDTGRRLAIELRRKRATPLPDPPRLPERVRNTTVWVATCTGKNTFHVWRCAPGRVWEDLGPYPLR